MERHIVSAAVYNRDAFEAFVSRGIEEELSPPAQVIFEQLHKYYVEDPAAKGANVELICEYVLRAQPKLANAITGVLKDLPDTSKENVVALWLASKRSAVGKRLASALADDRESDVDGLMEQYEFYKNYDDREVQRTFSMTDAIDLVEEENTKGSIPIYPKCINDAIHGRAGRDSNIVVFGRPNSGKTQFVINATSRMMMLGYKVLYCCNEESPKKLLLRYISRLSDTDIDDVRANPTDAFDTAVANGYENLTMHQMVPGTILEISNMVDKHRPDVLVVDQIRNLSMKDASLTQVLERSGTALRNIGNRFGCLTIGITQAGDSATNKAILDMNDVEYSNTGLAATADLMIGVGIDESLRAKSMIVLTICKNKITDIEQSYPVVVNRQRSKIRST